MYRGLTSSRLTRRCPSDERTSAARRRIYERSSTILPPCEKSLLPESSEMTSRLPPRARGGSNFRTIFSTYRSIGLFAPILSARPTGEIARLFLLVAVMSADYRLA